MKKLIIPEKPSVARDIAKALGGFSTTSAGVLESATVIIAPARGHLVELCVPEAEGFAAKLPIIPEKFGLQIAKGRDAGDSASVAKQFNLIKSQINRPDVSVVVNACDAGREGELIFRYIVMLAGCRKPMQRMWMQTMTDEGIRAAWGDVRDAAEYNGLAAAAQSRSESDWLVGINGSRAASALGRQQGLGASVSVGRVMTPVLAILVDREATIRNFVPKDYYEVHGTFGLLAGQYVARWMRATARQDGDDAYRVANKEDAQALISKVTGVQPSQVRDESKPVSVAPPSLFDLTGLQKEANRKLGLTAAQTLEVAQALYERHKVTTYPRTDASVLPEDYPEKVRDALQSLFDQPLGEHAKRVIQQNWINPKNRKVFNNEKISDHFAIIPTCEKPKGLSEVEAKVFHMICQRFIAVFHPNAEFQHTTRTTIVAGETFRASGRVMTSPGWKIVYGAGDDEDEKSPVLCALKAGELAKNLGMKLHALKTKPPARFNESTLLAAMETAGKHLDDEGMREAMGERGLGTPATRAATIEKLLSAKVGMMVREKKTLVPTDKGMACIKLLRDHGLSEITSAEMTGEWEKRLHQVEEGEVPRKQFMSDIVSFTTTMVHTLQKSMKLLPEIDGKCPACGGHVHDDGARIRCAACDWTMFPTVAKRRLTAEDVSTLLKNKKTALLSGFFSTKSGKEFSAHLTLNGKHEVEFEFPPR